MQYDTAQSLTPCSMILRGVNFEKLEHIGEISTKIKTILTHSQWPRQARIMKKNRLKILLDFPFKYDTEKSNDSAQYHTAQNLTLRSMILRGAL